MNGRKNCGMTMVEIIVAFVMLALVMAILYSCIQFASNLMKTAVDIDRGNEAFENAVVKKFKKQGAYELGTASNITYTFKEKNADGTLGSGRYDVQLYSANVTFEKNSTGYSESSASSGDNLRRIYLFSTGGEGSSSSGDEIRHSITYMYIKGGESSFSTYAAGDFAEGTGVSAAVYPADTENYTFDGWYLDPAFAQESKAGDISALTKTALSDVVLYGRYVEKAVSARYTIKYIAVNPQEELDSVVVNGAAAGTTITLSDSQINSYPGLKCDMDSSVTSAVISADGNTEFLVYYTRNVYVLTYVIIYSDGTEKSIVTNFAYGGYKSNGEKITELVDSDGKGQFIESWYTNDDCTGDAYTLDMLKKAESSVTLYTKLDKIELSGGAGVDNMEDAPVGDKFSEKMPKMNSVPEGYNFWAGFGPYDNGSSYDNYILMRDSINAALSGFGYSTGNVYLSCSVNGNNNKVYVMDGSYKGVPAIYADMTKDQITELIAGSDYKDGGYDIRIPIPADAVAVYETSLNVYAGGGYDWQKIDESAQLYLDVSINRGNYYNGNWNYWGFTVKITE